MTLTADVNRPEFQKVLVCNEACLQFGKGYLFGATIVAFWFCLPSPACLRWGKGPVCSWLALLSPLFCKWAWQCLRAFLGIVLSLSLSLSFFFSLSLSLSLVIAQSGLLSQVSSLKLPSGHLGPILTLSNAARPSLSSPRLQVVDVSVWAASPLGVAIRHVMCGF